MALRQRLEHLHSHPQFASALSLIAKLQSRGYATVFAGGCVRDSWLGLTPKDLDLATAAPPEVVEQSFARTLAVGKAFGTIVVIEGEHNFEVTTFRKDGPYVDGRHPVQVEFSDIEEDARRRDFTVNALFYDPSAEEILDFVAGVRDLQQSILRTVGSPHERFREDHLRMLRAARFVAQLGFTLEQNTQQAILQLHQNIKQVSAERIFNEMRKLLEGAHLCEGLQILQQTKLSQELWPDLNNFNLQELGRFLPLRNWENAYAAITLLSEPQQATPGSRLDLHLRQWKAPRASIQQIDQQISDARSLLRPGITRAERALILGSPLFGETLLLARGLAPEKIPQIEHWIAEFLTVTDALGQLPKPWITGKDLLNFGFVADAKMGQLLKSFYHQQLEGTLASREEALGRLHKKD